MTLQITVNNAETGEIVTRDMNAQELANYADLLKHDADLTAKELAAADAKAAAQAKLAALGLTTDDLKALGL